MKTTRANTVRLIETLRAIYGWCVVTVGLILLAPFAALIIGGSFEVTDLLGILGCAIGMVFPCALVYGLGAAYLNKTREETARPLVQARICPACEEPLTPYPNRLDCRACGLSFGHDGKWLARRLGRCRVCDYDQADVDGPCPECGAE